MADDRYEDIVEYPFASDTGRLCVWNVYTHQLPNGDWREGKWSGNAGLWVEYLSPQERIYHCSHGALERPDFDSLVFKVTVTNDKA